MSSFSAPTRSRSQTALLASARCSPGWAYLLLSVLAFIPSALDAQRRCPDSPFPRVTSDGTSPLVMVARLTGVILDREPPDAGAQPYVSMQHAILTYQPLVELLGHRDDSNHDFYGELPKLGGPIWTVGSMYLLVLAPMADSGREDRATYWTAACFGTQQVASIDEAKRILEAAHGR